MKRYNEKVLERTKRIKDSSYSNAMDQADRATHPSPMISRIGAMISGSVGFILMIVGLFFREEKWGWPSLCGGMIVVGVNLYHARKKCD